MTTLRADEEARDAGIDEKFVSEFLHDRRALRRYEEEIRDSGLVEHLGKQAGYFWSTVAGMTSRGGRYNTGRITGRDGYDEGVRLYAVVRRVKPQAVVETGVCNGVSTAFLLLALERNGGGRLFSIDFPEFAGERYEEGVFWEGKGGAVIPEGKEPGWMIPESLRGPWELRLGRSQDELPPLLEQLGTIDFFLHDSEHSDECMTFEFTHAFDALRTGGVLAADDVNASNAFFEFAAKKRREPVPLGAKMAFLVK